MEKYNLETSLYEKLDTVQTLEEFLEWEASCEELIKKLKEQITAKDPPLNIDTKNDLLVKLTQLESHRHILKKKFVYNEEISSKSKIVESYEFFWKEMETAFDRRLLTGAVINISYVNPQHFLVKAEDNVIKYVRDYLEKYNYLKVDTVFSAEFMSNDKISNKSFKTKNHELFLASNLHEWYMKHVVTSTMSAFEELHERDSDSGWSLSRIFDLTVNINKYNPLQAGCYEELPTEIKMKKAIVNIKSHDNACFAHAIMAALHPTKKHPYRISCCPDYTKVLNLQGIELPMPLSKISKFEELNDMSVNIYIIQKEGCKKEIVVPMRLTKRYQKDRHVNLLFLPKKNNKDIGHYAWIKNLSRLIDSQISHNKCKKYICNRCLHYFFSNEKLEKHSTDCGEINDCRISLPSEKDKWCNFNNNAAKQRLPFTIYADLEYILEKDYNDEQQSGKSYRHQYHKVFNIGYYVHCDYDNSIFQYRAFRGKDGAITWFINELKMVIDRLKTEYRRNVKIEQRSESEWSEILNTATHCYLCDKLFISNDIRVRDYCYFSGNFQGIAHQSCNLNNRITYILPIIFHNLSGYDAYFIINEIASSFEGKLEILPLTKETYISFTQNVRQEGTQRWIKLRFIDSYKFLNISLDKLSLYLDKCKLKIVHKGFRDLSNEKFILLTKKGVIPYQYIDTYEKLSDTTLPSLDCFYSTLTGNTISNDNYVHVINIWQKFNIHNLGEYSDLYLKLNVLLLADIFEHFRDNCLQNYELDPAYYYTMPRYSWHAMLKYTGIKLELLTDIDMLLFIERGIRGGITQCIHRYESANNKYMGNFYNPNQPSTYLTYFNVNNFYEWAMSQPLPYANFQWVSNITNFDVLSIPLDSTTGYILEVDLFYPQHLHDMHTDFPFCPAYDKSSKSNEAKLMTTLHDKKCYVIHYYNLQQCIRHGLCVTKIHRILQFSQSAWLKNYVELNMLLRQQANNEFDKNLFKLMNVAVFDKTMENVRDRVDVKLLTKWEGRYGIEEAIAKSNFHSRYIFSENLVAIQLKKLIVEFNKPMYVGMCILDISKTRLYDFHYEHMLPQYRDKCKIMYIDTNSLIYRTECEDVYKDIKCYLDKFDTSDFKINNVYDIPLVNKEVPGLIKDKNNGEVMTEFIGLRAKMYTFKLNNIQTKEIKSMRKDVIAKTITFDDYLTCLKEQSEMPRQQVSIRSELVINEVYTISE